MAAASSSAGPPSLLRSGRTRDIDQEQQEQSYWQGEHRRLEAKLKSADADFRRVEAERNLLEAEATRLRAENKVLRAKTQPNDEPGASLMPNTFHHAGEQAPTLRRSRSESTISDSSGPKDKVNVFYETSESGPHQLNDGTPPKDDAASTTLPPGFPSRGSALHLSGCKPCSFFNKGDGCIVGFDCDHCHFRHEIKNRPGRKARDRQNRLTKRDNEEREVDTDPSASSSKPSL